MIKKIFVILVSLILLTGCAKHISAEQINFSTWGSVSEIKIIKQIIKEFETENPDIKVNLIHIPQNYFPKIHLLFASNTEPDVIFINNLYLPVYENRLLSLDEYVNKDEFYFQAISGLSYNNNLLAIPRDISNLVFYINTDILKSKNIEVPSKNWTLDDLLKISQRIKDNQVFALGCENEIYWITPYLLYFNGGVLSDDGNIIIDSENSHNAIKFYKELVTKYHVAPTKSQVGSSTLAQMFLDKSIAIYLSGRWMYPKIQNDAEFNWIVLNFPYGKSKSLSDTSGWAISKNTKHKDASVKFVKYLSNKHGSEYFTQTGLIVPALKENSYLLNNSEHNEKAFLDVITQSKPTPVNKNYKKITDKINSRKDLSW